MDITQNVGLRKKLLYVKRFFASVRSCIAWHPLDIHVGILQPSLKIFAKFLDRVVATSYIRMPTNNHKLMRFSYPGTAHQVTVKPVLCFIHTDGHIFGASAMSVSRHLEEKWSYNNSWASEEGEGVTSLLDFENFSKTSCFLSLEWERKQISSLLPLLRKIFEKSLSAPLWKKSCRRSSC